MLIARKACRRQCCKLQEKSDLRAIVVLPVSQLKTFKAVNNAYSKMYDWILLKQKQKNATIKRNDTFTNENIKKGSARWTNYTLLATFADPKIFSTFLLAFLFYFTFNPKSFVHRWTVKKQAS